MTNQMKKSIAIGLFGAAALLSAGAARASHVNWSIGISLPPIGAVVSNGPAYAPVYAPVYEPAYAPVYVAPPVVAYRPVPVAVYPRAYGSYGYYAPSPIVYGAPYGRWHDGRGYYTTRGGWQPVPRDGRRQHH